MVVPAFTALLPKTIWNILSKHSPMVCAIHIDQVEDENIFWRCPDICSCPSISRF